MKPLVKGKPKVKIYGLVRDANGKPKIEGDLKDLDPNIKALLTPEERKELEID